MIFSVTCPCGARFSIEVDQGAGAMLMTFAYQTLLGMYADHRKESRCPESPERASGAV